MNRTNPVVGLIVPVGSAVSPSGARGIEGEQGERGEKGFPGTPIPVGSMLPYGGQAPAPDGYLFCDGASYSRQLFPELAQVLGTTYGGNAENFNVPDLKARIPIGIGGLDYAPDWAWHLGEKFGAPGHTLTIGEMPSHNHGNVDINHAHTIALNAHGHGDPWHIHGMAVAWRLPATGQNWLDCPPSVSGDYYGQTIGAGTGIQNAGNFGGSADWLSNQAANYHLRGTGNAGSGGAHNNCQPCLGVNYIIKT